MIEIKRKSCEPATLLNNSGTMLENLGLTCVFTNHQHFASQYVKQILVQCLPKTKIGHVHIFVDNSAILYELLPLLHGVEYTDNYLDDLFCESLVLSSADYLTTTTIHENIVIVGKINTMLYLNKAVIVGEFSHQKEMDNNIKIIIHYKSCRKRAISKISSSYCSEKRIKGIIFGVCGRDTIVDTNACLSIWDSVDCCRDLVKGNRYACVDIALIFPLLMTANVLSCYADKVSHVVLPQNGFDFHSIDDQIMLDELASNEKASDMDHYLITFNGMHPTIKRKNISLAEYFWKETLYSSSRNVLFSDLIIKNNES